MWALPLASFCVLQLQISKGEGWVVGSGCEVL